MHPLRGGVCILLYVCGEVESLPMRCPSTGAGGCSVHPSCPNVQEAVLLEKARHHPPRAHYHKRATDRSACPETQHRRPGRRPRTSSSDARPVVVAHKQPALDASGVRRGRRHVKRLFKDAVPALQGQRTRKVRAGIQGVCCRSQACSSRRGLAQFRASSPPGRAEAARHPPTCAMRSRGWRVLGAAGRAPAP